jgi:hypothetical protein
MYSKGAICLSRLLFKMGLFTVYKHKIFTFCFLLLDNEPISGSIFSSFLHILPLKLLLLVKMFIFEIKYFIYMIFV